MCVLDDSICIPNFVCLRQSGRRGGHFKPLPLPFGHAHFRKFQIPKIFTEPDVCAKICEFSWSFRPSKMHSFRQKERKNPYKYNRSLGTIGARALIKTASGGERALAPACGPPPVAVGFLLRSTSCWSQEVGPRDFLVRLGRLYMRTEFRSPTTKLAGRPSLWRCHGNGKSEIESFFDNY